LREISPAGSPTKLADDPSPSSKLQSHFKTLVKPILKILWDDNVT